MPGSPDPATSGGGKARPQAEGGHGTQRSGVQTRSDPWDGTSSTVRRVSTPPSSPGTLRLTGSVVALPQAPSCSGVTVCRMHPCGNRRYRAGAGRRRRETRPGICLKPLVLSRQSRRSGGRCAVRVVGRPLGGWARRPEPGSRWSARSGARTNDLDAGEDRRRVREEDGSAGGPFGGGDALRWSSPVPPGR